MEPCIFCELISKYDNTHISNVIFKNKDIVAFYDNYPVSKGHTLIIPKRHVKSYFELNLTEILSINDALRECKKFLTQMYSPDGFNIGINDGEAAGQTVFHLHIHLIPRYFGDMEDPKGGVRGVIPNKQKY